LPKGKGEVSPTQYIHYVVEGANERNCMMGLAGSVPAIFVPDNCAQMWHNSTAEFLLKEPA
jgi:hypothetical protein